MRLPWRQRVTARECPAPGCSQPYDECLHRADEIVWEYALAHGRSVTASQADRQPHPDVMGPTAQQRPIPEAER